MHRKKYCKAPTCIVRLVKRENCIKRVGNCNREQRLKAITFNKTQNVVLYYEISFNGTEKERTVKASNMSHVSHSLVA